MRSANLLVVLLLAALFAGCTSAPPPACDPCGPAPDVKDGRGDAVVVAVVDSGFDPYHYDFLASQMPQAKDSDASNDLPLSSDPSTWLPGYPAPSTFASFQPMALSLPTSPKDVPQKLHDADKKAWGAVDASTPEAIHMRWIPGTKVVGFVSFAGDDGFAPASHGVGTTSVSVGNLHGACPECLFVFVNGPSEEANRWVEAQDWIDAQTNSWGISTIPSPLGIPRDRVYTGSDTESQRNATERGQSIFFSAGNGLANDFSAPNPTLFSSQEGPDWIITVGAVSPDDQSAYSGAGKPVDIANIGSGYPSAGGGTVTANATFGGTSNATPVTAGEYARALYLVRREMLGDSRIQRGGVIVQGSTPCEDTDAANDAAGTHATADARQATGAGSPHAGTRSASAGSEGSGNSASCLPGEGVTVDALRHALFAAANYTNPNMNAGGQATLPASTKEATYAAEGHGSLTGRLLGEARLHEETERIAAFALGEREMPAPDLDQTEWFVADSYCRQGVWGNWTHGDYVGGNTTLPPPDPQWQARTFYVTACPTAIGTVVDAAKAAPSPPVR